MTHTIDSIYDRNAKILILGTMPSPKSREAGFYYSHPQNKFWPVLARVLDKQMPGTIHEKINFLHDNQIALWDVLKSCSIEGADDGSIRDPALNDITLILREADIKAIFTTGKKATELYRRYCYPLCKRESVYLPSTSPANCRYYTFDDLVTAYRVILKYLRDWQQY